MTRLESRARKKQGIQPPLMSENVPPDDRSVLPHSPEETRADDTSSSDTDFLSAIREMRERVDQCIGLLSSGVSNNHEGDILPADDQYDEIPSDPHTADLSEIEEMEPQETLPISEVDFIKSGMKLRLQAAGYQTVGDLAASDPEDIVADLGRALPMEWAKLWVDVAQRMIASDEG